MYIMDHLAWVHRLIREGVPIFGFTYWSLTDNWEWAEGFEPKFGLYEVNRETMERRPRRSVELFRFIARNNRLPTKEELQGEQFEFVKDYKNKGERNE
jgi:beta-glucosidase